MNIKIKSTKTLLTENSIKIDLNKIISLKKKIKYSIIEKTKILSEDSGEI